MSATNIVEVGPGFAPNRVQIAGDGAPVVYLHGLLGPEWPGLLEDLAADHRVYAPASPGIAEVADLENIADIWELVLYYDDLFGRLGLDQVDLVGHSFGGMVAAEIAAIFPQRVRRLVLIDPLGLWLPESPVPDHLMVSPDRRTDLLFTDRSADEVVQRLRVPDDLEAAQTQTLDLFDALGAAAHFTHPIPDRGLRKRLHRIAAPTLVVWGEEDRLTSVAYADAFAQGIAGSTVARFPGAGHHAHLERRDAVSERVREFLATGASA